jgi:hypothetical protein
MPHRRDFVSRYVSAREQDVLRYALSLDGLAGCLGAAHDGVPISSPTPNVLDVFLIGGNTVLQRGILNLVPPCPDVTHYPIAHIRDHPPPKHTIVMANLEALHDNVMQVD